jgi:hypothetical protein
MADDHLEQPPRVLMLGLGSSSRRGSENPMGASTTAVHARVAHRPYLPDAQARRLFADPSRAHRVGVFAHFPRWFVTRS